MHLTLHLTTACNMRCSYCYSPPRPGDAMSLQTACEALDFAAGLGGARSGIVLFGGEPLLHRERIVEIVAQARARSARGAPDYQLKLTTNGLALDEPFLAYAEQQDLLIAMSFDGVREAQDRHRHLLDGAPSYDRLLPKLQLLLRHRPYASVLSVVSPETVQHLVESVELLLDQGCRYLIVSLDYAGQWSEEQLQILEAQYRELADRYLEWTRAGRKFYLSPFEVKLASHIKGAEFGCDRCELARRQLSVDPQGYLYPCVQFTRAGPESPWCIGHVREGIDDAALGRIHDQADRGQPGCRDCALRQRCHHTCGCLNWQSTGQLDEVSPVLCRHEQILIPLADRIGEVLYEERNPHFLQKHYNPAYSVLSLMEDVLGPM